MDGSSGLHVSPALPGRELKGGIEFTPSPSPDILYRFPHRIQHILLIKKHNQASVSNAAHAVAAHLHYKHQVAVYVEPSVYSGERALFDVVSRPYVAQTDRALIQLVITVGGDGTVLHANSLFNDSAGLPPALAFAMGTLGFLTPFDITDYQNVLDQVMRATVEDKEPLAMSLCPRMRLFCRIFKTDESGKAHCAASFQPLNECLISRPPSSHSLTHIDIAMIPTLFPLNDSLPTHLTTLQADGLIISTATGSTAYSLSAGGSMVAPSTHCLLLTPVCPHTLSFRPIVLSDSTHLRFSLCSSAPTDTALVVFDGHESVSIDSGDYVSVQQSRRPLWSVNWIGQWRTQRHSSSHNSATSSTHPHNTVHVDSAARRSSHSAGDLSGELSSIDSTVVWFRAISSKLGWNTRQQMPVIATPMDGTTANVSHNSLTNNNISYNVDKLSNL